MEDAKPGETKAEYFADVIMGQWVEQRLKDGVRDISGFNLRREGVLMGLRWALDDPDEIVGTPATPESERTPR
jgi:hypothetical protein